MPEMGGIEAAIKLLEICPATKNVLVAASVSPETRAFLEAQVYGFETLPAPFSSRDLRAVVFGKSRA
jgi:CheY-like chemotaxis protein